jgi:hypothetical protein
VSDTIKQSNYVRGQRCFWLHKSTMNLLHIGGPKLAGCNATPLFFTKPSKPDDFFRVYIEPVRTKKDTARMLAKYAKKEGKP